MNKIVNKAGIYATSFRYIVQTTFSGEGNFDKRPHHILCAYLCVHNKTSS